MKLSQASDQLRGVLRDWRGVLANGEYAVRDHMVCWNAYKPSRLPANLTFEDVARLASERQYSFQFAKDGSLLQLFYQFGDGKHVQSATLAYLQGQPGGYELLDQTGQEDSTDEELLDSVEAGRERGDALAPRWVRIDFVETQSFSPVHACCHLHLYGFPDSRVTLSNLPNPKQFVEMVMAWFYPDEYRRRRFDEAGRYKDVGWMKHINRHAMDCEDAECGKHLVHLRLPKTGLF